MKNAHKEDRTLIQRINGHIAAKTMHDRVWAEWRRFHPGP